MKKVFVLVFGLIFIQQLNAQSILDRIKQKAKNKVDQKVDEKLDKAVSKPIDAADDAVSGKSKKKQTGNTDNNTNTGNSEDANSSKGNSKSSSGEGFKSYSKFDFVPGEKLVAAEDFSQDNVGDFPDKWNTNGSGEIVTTNLAAGKYLMSQKEAVFYPEWINSLPENFTIEFDLLSNTNYNYYSGYFSIGFTTEKNIGKDWRSFGRFGNGGTSNDLVQIGFHPTNAGANQGMSVFSSFHKGVQSLKNEVDQNMFTSKNAKTKVHISIWRQKQRVRVYLDDKKVWDIPKALEAEVKLNSLFFRNDGGDKEADAFYFGNVRVAVGAPDTRNKLITEGKFVTHGILFDVNSDKIKPESYGALKDIANVLTENAEVKVKIIGHTDADGDDKSNLDLSKRRADAVKAMLTKEFGVNAERMQTEGKGESQPVNVNTTLVGKANNRRVEFIKQ